MANRTTSLTVRIEPEIKAHAEQILQQLGISASTAINMFYKQIILRKGVPFDLTLPGSKMLNITNMSDDQLALEIQKGLDDFQAGRSQPADKVFEEIEKKLGL